MSHSQPENEIREQLANDLERVAQSLGQMLGTWYDTDARPDILAEDEFPFDLALEDLVANVWHAAGLIRERDNA